MASQSPEPALPDQKSVKPAEAAETDARNGTGDMNGHTSPMDVTSEPKSPAAPSGKENGDTNGTEHEKKQDAPATNSIPESEAPNPESSETKLAQSADDEAEQDKPSADDTEMADAHKVQSPVGEDMNETAPSPAKDLEVASPLPDVTDKPSSEDAKPDVEMGDASPTAAVPSSAEPAASTQDTAVSEPPAETPAEDLNLHPVSMSSLAIDATPVSPGPATTADTSMSDPPQSGVKVARDREEDDEEQPAAKRLKTATPDDSVEVKTGPSASIAVNRDGAESTSLYKADGRPKNLADPSLDGNEITRYQSVKIRGILAGIKKTKAGVNFKSPVSTLWPLLWEDYRLKISEPTDISTMEKRLKGAGDPEFPPYPNMGAFKRDLELIYQNSLTFNGPIHNVTAQAKTVWEQVLERMASVPAVETAVEEKKAAKQHPTRHAEPRATAQASPAQPPRRPSKPAVPSPVDKTAPSPAYAIPPNNHGVPLIRRDSTKNVDDRPKRPVHPPKSKDFGYDVKKKNKLPLELRFCREVLDELVKGRHHDINQFFMVPVDPVALQIPNYYKIIKKPMDLQTVGEKLNHGQYNNSREFERDIQLIIKNAVMFNGADHIVTHCAQQLDEVFKEEWAKKDAWMAKRAPASAPQASSAASRAKHEEDSDDEDADSDEEEEQKPRDTTTPHLEALQRRLKEEQEKLNELMIAKVPDINMVEVSQTMIAVLQKQVIQERQKLAEAPPPKKNKKAQHPAAKAKRPSGAHKKATAQAAGSSGGGAPGKKAGGGPKKKRHMGSIEKEVIGAAIPELDGTLLERAIDIIKKDTNQNVRDMPHASALSENDSGELELDIEALSQDALTKLYDLSIKNFPNLRAEKEAEVAAAAPPPVPEPVSKPKTSKPKKNKPMGKAEQEARLRQLSDLKAAIKGRGSNSQEPIESIEGNGGASASVPAYESEEESSEEE
ncbi:Bromodomain-containing protein [Coniochaeta ligniaria NRRL 30616]|uniref:Bromodomain-containing protein n=1 Tax=Coniochaeta ligniaria NRRL 30616 TaxID=1408157 RepID=A0A1J7IE67_9PEZI|nr:Bromodomain-containing protein [Coniochaeta ligniaria NRRL 30616]